MDYSQHVRLRARNCTFMILTVLVTMAASLLTPADASASRYRWKEDKDGNWNVSANWFNVDGDPDGYPNDPSDVVLLNPLGTAARRITIPKNVTIFVRQITLIGSQNYYIHGEIGGAGDTRGMLAFDSAVPGGAEVSMLGTNAELGFVLPIVLADPLTFYAGASSRISIFTGILSFVDYNVIKTGPGTLDFYGHNTYVGPTIVKDGLLELRSLTDEVTVAGILVVGDGIDAPHSATVSVWSKNQIEKSYVDVYADGWFEFLQSDDIGHITMHDGTVVLKQNTQVTLTGLKMTGGELTIDVGSTCTLDGDVTAASSAAGPAKVNGDVRGALHLSGTRSFHVNGPGTAANLEIAVPVTGGPDAAFVKDGPGVLVFTGLPANTYSGQTRVVEGTLFSRRPGVITIPSDLYIGFDGRTAATVRLDENEAIADNASVGVNPGGQFLVNAKETIAGLVVTQGNVTLNSAEAHLIVTGRIGTGGGDLALNFGRLSVSEIVAHYEGNGLSTIHGDGVVVARGNELKLVVAEGPDLFDLEINARVESETTQGVTKSGPGAARLSSDNAYKGPTTILDGTLVVIGRQPASLVRVVKGTLSGIGSVGGVIGESATIAPGLQLGRGPAQLTTHDLTFSSATIVDIELSETEESPGGYDQFVAGGTVTLGNAVLEISSDVAPRAGASFTIIDNDDKDPVIGTFAGLPEGSTLDVRGGELRISYRGGDGNDVVLSNGNPYTYFLAEGATGDFFDNDVLIANPGSVDAPVTLTFLKEGGSTVIERRTVPARTRLTVHVDDIAGLENASASTKVASDDYLPLIVERTMFWDASYYGGHTANAADQPQKRWIFAEGSQGFFDTYILIANANAEPTTATLTFLRENATPFVATVPVEPFARKTVHTGAYPELVDRSFGIVVEADRPIIAERAMYFAQHAGRHWVGGHANTGIVAPSTSWFHAEGATGRFFTTFILLSNPQETKANVELRFLLDNGTVVTKQKTIEAKQRLTINPAVEDARLTDAALSTVVLSDVPIVSERSMYWAEAGTDFGEGHNSSGVVSTSTRWGLAEGRVGGPREFATYILLANPSTQAADVKVVYLREGGAPIEKTYTVQPTSRFNIDVKGDVPELDGGSFGAVIDVKNGVPIAVERSLYWNANGVLWAGGTNALATPLPVP